MRFTQTWFEDGPKSFWEAVVRGRPIRSYLEIGSFEGASACWAIQNLPELEQVVCIDTWEGGSEHLEYDLDMSEVEKLFEQNITEAGQALPRDINLVKLKHKSKDGLLQLLLEGYEQCFDLVYIDGSHKARDVLTDLILSFDLLGDGGLMIIDDYLWVPPSGHLDQNVFNPAETPKLAIDAFTTIYRDSLKFIDCSWSQVMCEKR